MNKRAITSFVMLFSLVVLVPSGIMLHVTASDGSESTRHLLMTLHNAAALILVASAVFHLVFNAKPMVSYLKSKAAENPRFRAEAVVALAIVTVLIGVALLHVFHAG